MEEGFGVVERNLRLTMGKRENRKKAQKKKGVVKSAKNANKEKKRKWEEGDEEDDLLDELLAHYKEVDKEAVAVKKENVDGPSIRSGFF